MLITLYDFLVFVHILLFVFWLGADMEWRYWDITSESAHIQCLKD